MNSIYRIRPNNEHTIDEIENHYLWFSRRSGFNDINDANIGIFLDKNKILLEALQNVYTPEGIQELKEKMDCTGICCFTDKNPTYTERGHFPNYAKSICVEYNREILESFFEKSHYAMHDCFWDVQYFSEPTVFKEDDGYHILLKKDEDGTIIESILKLTVDEKGRDRLIRLLLTRINAKHRFQNEKRIILGGRNIPSFDDNIKGYKAIIPENAIIAIHTYKDTPKGFISKINKVKPNINVSST